MMRAMRSMYFSGVAFYSIKISFYYICNSNFIIQITIRDMQNVYMPSCCCSPFLHICKNLELKKNSKAHLLIEQCFACVLLYMFSSHSSSTTRMHFGGKFRDEFYFIVYYIWWRWCGCFFRIPIQCSTPSLLALRILSISLYISRCVEKKKCFHSIRYTYTYMYYVCMYMYVYVYPWCIHSSIQMCTTTALICAWQTQAI